MSDEQRPPAPIVIGRQIIDEEDLLVLNPDSSTQIIPTTREVITDNGLQKAFVKTRTMISTNDSRIVQPGTEPLFRCSNHQEYLLTSSAAHPCTNCLQLYCILHCLRPITDEHGKTKAYICEACYKKERWRRILRFFLSMP